MNHFGSFSVLYCLVLLIILQGICKSQDNPWMVYTNRKTIDRIDIGTLDTRNIVTGLKGAIAVDYHYSKNYLYWTDQTADLISRAKISNTEVTEDIIKYTPGRADGIAIDWVYDHMYWIDSEHKHIKVSQLDGKLRKTLVDSGLSYPRAIAVHPIEGYLFFTDVIESRIYRCALDGTNLNIIVSNRTSQLDDPNGLSIDFLSNRLYWVDNKLKQIRHSKFDGTDIHILTISHSYMPYAWGLAVDGDWLYWTSFDNNTIYRVDKETATNYSVVQTGLDQPVGIKIYNKENQPSRVNLCGQHNGGCEQLCFLNYVTGIACECADGFQLESDRKSCLKIGNTKWLTFANDRTIERLDIETTVSEIVASSTNAGDLDIHYKKGLVYWVDMKENRIMRTNVTNDSFSGISDVVVKEETGAVSSLAIDWIYDLLFWTDSGQGQIQVAHLSGNYKRLIVKDIEEPKAIAVDPKTGWLFYSSFGISAKIRRCRMDGSDRTIIIQYDISQPYGLSVDSSDGRLYWADANLNQIKSTKFDGTGTYAVIQNSNLLPKPFGLVVFDNYVYWSNWEYRSILRTDKYTGKQITVEARNVFKPMGIQMFGPGSQLNVPNYCGNDNGGCSHICYPIPVNEGLQSAKYGCMCADSYKLEADNKHCIQEHNNGDSNTGSSNNNTMWYAIIGIGCAVFIIVVSISVFVCLRKIRQNRPTSQEDQHNNSIYSVYDTINEGVMLDKSEEDQRPISSYENTMPNTYVPLSSSQMEQTSVYDGLDQSNISSGESHHIDQHSCAFENNRSSFENPGYHQEVNPCDYLDKVLEDADKPKDETDNNELYIRPFA